MKIIIIFLFISQAFASDLQFPTKDKFLFGVANAPVQAEDQLDDVWMEFARNGKTAAFNNQAFPEKKLEFWSKPEIEINLAADLGVDIFRLGIDWTRIMTTQVPYSAPMINLEVVARYKKILQLIKAKNMKVMLTLFHHSEPMWTLKKGSWKNPEMKAEFVGFVKNVLPYLISDIDYLITFNEPHFYITMTQLSSYWPSPLKKAQPLGMFNFGPYKGIYEKSLDNMALAHQEIYEWVKKVKPELPIGIAHNVADYDGNKLTSYILWKKMNDLFLDKIINSVDFIGLNYYGVEKIKGLTVSLDSKTEYSDSGRGISPQGLYKIIHHFDKKYHKLHLPYFITENGIADSSDRIRPAYLIEHLKVIHQLMNEGISFLGYIHWTLTDNFEWADGYCPKFGLVAVNRTTGERIKGDTFELYKNIIANRIITDDDQLLAWDKISALKKKLRPSCRDLDGVTALDEYRFETFKGIDWRFK